MKPGDIVRPVMTVEEISEDSVTCIWHEGGELRSQTFPTKMLEAPPDPNELYRDLLDNLVADLLRGALARLIPHLDWALIFLTRGAGASLDPGVLSNLEGPRAAELLLRANVAVQRDLAEKDESECH